ncbi:hypothetical protein [uncultured Microscilla sp.]|uniref:hypothetical protein n=1 Tax=uncultured Microscilla sp. TaxID=432653 RepID=UPI0026193A64|nr:hypothetical protein [uncultured Microscilla sp.]
MKKYTYIGIICLLMLAGGCGTRQVKEQLGEIRCNNGIIQLRTTSYPNQKDHKLYIQIDLIYNGKVVSQSIGRKGIPMAKAKKEVKFMKVNHKSESGLNIYIDPHQLPRDKFNQLVRCIQLNEQNLVSLINEVPNQYISEQDLKERQSINTLVYGNYDDMGQLFYADKHLDQPLQVYVAIDGTCQLRNNDEWHLLGRVFEGYLDISEVHYNRIKNYQSRNGVRLADYFRLRNIKVVYEDR